MNSGSSSSLSTIIEYFRMSKMNFDKSWCMTYGSSLREEEETFDNPCFESSQTIHDAGKSRPLRKAAAAAAAIRYQCIREQSPTTGKKRIPSRGQNLDHTSWMTDVEKTILETLTLKYVCFDTMMNVEREEVRANIKMPLSQYREWRVHKNPKINWKDHLRFRIGRIAFTAEASKQV